MKSTVAALTLILAMAGTAAAQPGKTSPPLPEPEPRQAEPKPTQLEPGQAEPKLAQPLPGDGLSEGAALGLSIGGTAVSWAMIGVAVGVDRPGNSTVTTIGWIGLGGAVLAPSFGHWYAGTFATRGLGLRLAGAGLTTLALLSVIVMCEDECTPTIPEALLIAGVGFAIAGTIDDIATVPRDVHRHNQRLYNASIVPVVRRDSSSVGLAITGRF